MAMDQRSDPGMTPSDVTPLGRTPFERAVRPHLRALQRLALRFTGRREEAEDLLQDLLTHLYARHDTVVALDQPGPWLRRVLYRRFVDRWRRRQADPVDYTAEDVSAATETPDAAPDAELERHLDRQRLQQALDALSPDHRSVILLHDVEGYTLPEIAQMLEVTEGTLKSRLHRARNNLRQRLLADAGWNESTPAPVNTSRGRQVRP
jgi:RNA polymerase sigma-70 factor, ECF subfamily